MLRALNRDGWYLDHQTGSHAILRHPQKRGTVTVPIPAGTTVKLGTLANVLRQAGLTRYEFRELL